MNAKYNLSPTVYLLQKHSLGNKLPRGRKFDEYRYLEDSSIGRGVLLLKSMKHFFEKSCSHQVDSSYHKIIKIPSAEDLFNN